jgi:hypothetical protein
MLEEVEPTVRLVRFFSEDVPVPRWCVYGGLAAAILLVDS